MTSIVDLIVSTFGVVGTHAAVIVLGALVVAFLMWGVPRLVQFFKRVVAAVGYDSYQCQFCGESVRSRDVGGHDC